MQGKPCFLQQYERHEDDKRNITQTFQIVFVNNAKKTGRRQDGIDIVAIL
jgi:hypothetical protein